MPRGFLRLLATTIMILPGCSPLVRNPIELAPFAYVPAYGGKQLALDLIVQTRQPGPEKTSSVTLPAAESAYVRMGGYDVPLDQLLTEAEQREIATLLANAVVSPSQHDLCTATFAFEELDYQFHQHQYWATVALTVSQGGRPLATVRHKVWSAEGMTFSNRMNAHPQTGKQSLAHQLLNAFAGSIAQASHNELSVCAI